MFAGIKSPRSSRIWLVLASVPVLLAITLGCGGSSDSDDDEDVSTPTVASAAPTAPVTPSLASPAAKATVLPDVPGTWVYWLSDIVLQAIADAAPPVTVIDYSQDGGPEGAFNSADIQQLRSALPDPALVIAYMSIGEAEDYRFYWQDDWKTGSPGWLDSVNPDWAGNFKVRYWDADWQSVVFGSEEAYLDQILAAGFDGVYLDIIDAYEYFAERGRGSAEDEMVEFVTAIGEYARRQHPGFLVIPQNSPELGLRADYLAAVDGIGMESIYFGYDEQDEATEGSVTSELEEILEVWTAAGKLVLAVDYVTSPDNIAEAYELATGKQFTHTVTDVELGGLPFPPPSR
jgi:cysteinyl-tRNA synthetase